MASAVSIWITGAIGMAVANLRFDNVIGLSVLNFLTLRFGAEGKKGLKVEME